MSTDRDVDRIVRSWLEEGVRALPDRVLDTVLEQLPATQQRRSRWPTRRFADMNNYAKVAIAAAAVAVVAVAAIGITLIPRAGSVGGSPAALTPTAAATPTLTSTASPASMPTPSPAPSGAAPTANSAEVVRDFPGARVGPAGRYAWDPDSRPYGPLGWMHKLDSHLEITFRPSDRGYGPGPTAVTVGGYVATYQELLVNSEEVLKEQVWILDIDGTPVTIAVASGPDASAADLAEAQAIIDSIRIEPTNTSTGFRLTFDLLAGWDSG